MIYYAFFPFLFLEKTRTRPSEDVKVKSLCVLQKKIVEKPQLEKEKSKKKSRTRPQPTLVCGVSLRRTKLSLSNMDTQNGSSEIRTDVQLMNKVNEVVSSDSHPRIIPNDGSQINNCQSDLLSSTSFIPHLVVVATKDCSKKKFKSREKDNKKLTSSISTSSLNVPTLGSIVMDHDWGILDPMFDSDPDPDCQIVGVTPGPTGLSVESPTGNKSLSDGDITKSQSSSNDVSVSGKSTKPKAGSVLQCIELPCEVRSENLEITEITPTLDGQHIIVSVTPIKQNLLISTSVKNLIDKSNDLEDDNSDEASEIPYRPISSSDIDISLSTKKSADFYSGGCLLIYKLNYSEDYVKVDETPVMAKFIDSPDNSITSILVLPQDVSGSCEEEEDKRSQTVPSMKPKSSELFGQLSVTLYGGKFWLLNICDLQVIAEVSPPELDKFVSTTYCIGLYLLLLTVSYNRNYFRWTMNNNYFFLGHLSYSSW